MALAISSWCSCVLMFCDCCAWISVVGIGFDEKDEEDDSHLLLTTSREKRCIGGMCCCITSSLASLYSVKACQLCPHTKHSAEDPILIPMVPTFVGE